MTKEEVQQAAICGNVLSLVSDVLESSASAGADVKPYANAVFDVNVIQKHHKDSRSGSDNSGEEAVTKSLCIPRLAMIPCLLRSF